MSSPFPLISHDNTHGTYNIYIYRIGQVKLIEWLQIFINMRFDRFLKCHSVYKSNEYNKLWFLFYHRHKRKGEFKGKLHVFSN